MEYVIALIKVSPIRMWQSLINTIPASSIHNPNNIVNKLKHKIYSHCHYDSRHEDRNYKLDYLPDAQVNPSRGSHCVICFENILILQVTAQSKTDKSPG